jgi:hypothetical protein
VDNNPWRRLPSEAPYVLPEDEEDVRAFNANARQNQFLHLDLVPEPFIGWREAPVVLLGNNPGVKSPESAALRRKPAFASRMRNNLLHRLSADFPFLYLDPDTDIASTGKDWWERKLRCLFSEFGPDREIARSILAKSILAIEFFPYVSHRYRHGRLSLPSQQYSFTLVRNAMSRGAVIVLTRGERRWKNAVEGQSSYPRLLELQEKQRAPISPGNCQRYQEIVAAIKASVE